MSADGWIAALLALAVLAYLGYTLLHPERF